MPNKTIEKDHLLAWIHEIQYLYSQHEVDLWKRLRYFIEEGISHSPEALAKFLKKNKDSGIHSLPNIKFLIDELICQLLSRDSSEHAAELLELAAEWDVHVNGAVLQQLADTYAQGGHLSKAKEVLYRVLTREPQNTEVLRALFNCTKAEGHNAEAHTLLNRLLLLDSSHSTVTFAYRERIMLPPDTGRPLRTALLSSYILDQLVPYLDLECRKINLSPAYYVTPFNQYTQEILNPASALYQFNPEIVFIALAIEDLFPEILGYPSVNELEQASKEICERVFSLVGELHGRCGALIVVYEFALLHRSPHGILDNRSPNSLGKWIDDVNRVLGDHLLTYERAYLLPVDQVLSWVGKERANNPKMRYMASMRIGEAALPELAKYSMRYVKPLKGMTRKCIVLDLDDTLWGGIVGEVGPEGIHLGPTAPGAEYMDFQQALLNLTRRGTLLAVCSKNNPEDALPVIREHPYMILREEHFSAICINWSNKAENLTKIAEQLNIGLDSIVFIDDNPLERELIKQLLPEVFVLELPTDPSRYRMVLEELSDFELLTLTHEDITRVAQYRALQKRDGLRRSSSSLEEYLRSLKITAEIQRASKDSLHRLVQMFNKTNQFNLTTPRYQTADISHFLSSDEHLVYTLKVCDRFGDHGTVGAAIIQQERSSWRIDSFLMSCRVMGLSVETAFLQRIQQDAHKAGVQKLLGEFIPSKKNQPAEEVYPSHGFKLVNDTCERQLWVLDMTVAKIDKPDWIATSGASMPHDNRTGYQQSV